MSDQTHELPNSCAECNYCFNSSAPDIPIWECGLESHGEAEEYAACSVLVDKDGKPFDFRPFWCLLNRGRGDNMSYIVPKEIPNRCGMCTCFHAEHPMYCQAVKADKNKRIYAPYGEGRPDWCPLIEVPPHGRLILENGEEYEIDG